MIPTTPSFIKVMYLNEICKVITNVKSSERIETKALDYEISGRFTFKKIYPLSYLSIRYFLLMKMTIIHYIKQKGSRN